MAASQACHHRVSVFKDFTISTSNHYTGNTRLMLWKYSSDARAILRCYSCDNSMVSQKWPITAWQCCRATVVLSPLLLQSLVSSEILCAGAIGAMEAVAMAKGMLRKPLLLNCLFPRSSPSSASSCTSIFFHGAPSATALHHVHRLSSFSSLSSHCSSPRRCTSTSPWPRRTFVVRASSAAGSPQLRASKSATSASITHCILVLVRDCGF